MDFSIFLPIFASAKHSNDASMAAINNNEKKLLELGLYVSLPINAQVLFTQSERDVLNTIRHLNNIGKRPISLSLFRVYTGLSDRTIRCALKSLLELGFIERGSVCKSGTYYKVLFKRFGGAIMRLNSERNPISRLRLADTLRGVGHEINGSLIKEFENTEFDTKV